MKLLERDGWAEVANGVIVRDVELRDGKRCLELGAGSVNAAATALRLRALNRSERRAGGVEVSAVIVDVHDGSEWPCVKA